FREQYHVGQVATCPHMILGRIKDLFSNQIGIFQFIFWMKIPGKNLRSALRRDRLRPVRT
ncbi:MAG: hypothetical protein Q7T92_08700, partial [Lutibacter sp.]|nr:hypothetical protein [Lutibacter sp.]